MCFLNIVDLDCDIQASRSSPGHAKLCMKIGSSEVGRVIGMLMCPSGDHK